VLVEVEREDGSQEMVRVGTARRDGAAFVLDLSALRIAPFEAAPKPQPVAAAPAPLASPSERRGGSAEDLEYIAARARRTLSDASKARWHAMEREILRQVELELARLKKPE